MKAEQNVPGLGVISSLGRFDSNDNVTFRWISRLVLALQSSEKLTNSITVNYRSGYHDKEITADDAQLRFVNADGSIGGLAGLTRDVKQYTTFDYQVRANIIKNLTLTAGVRNILDRDPPLSIRNTGGGNQVGYDGRYTDPIGRAYYLTAAYKY